MTEKNATPLSSEITAIGQLADIFDEGLLLTNTDGVVLSANQVAAQLFESDIVSKSIFDVIGDKRFGTAFHKPNGNAVKVTINEFRDKLYLHIREYGMDGDTGQWFPTKTGFSIPADEVSSLLPLLEEASELVAKRYVWNTQLELELE